MSNKLFVGNLSFNTTENDLNDAFAAHGTVTETNLMMDRMTNRPRGFGFVTMSSAEEAQKAIAVMNGSPRHSQAITGSPSPCSCSNHCLPKVHDRLQGFRLLTPALSSFEEERESCFVGR